jgi:hypothetical protein
MCFFLAADTFSVPKVTASKYRDGSKELLLYLRYFLIRRMQEVNSFMRNRLPLRQGVSNADILDGVKEGPLLRRPRQSICPSACHLV